MSLKKRRPLVYCGKKLEFNGTLWTELDDLGQLSCFYHEQNAYNLMAEIYIHSVYDIGFDENEGRMKVFSIINDANKTKKTSYANSTNQSVGNLAAQTSKSNNAYGVYQALRNAMDAGTVVDDKTILNEQSWWPDNVKDEETNKDIINLYNNYKKLSSESTSNNPSETGEEITINNKTYSIVGPFKVTFGGKGIKEVTAGDATWKSKSDTSIYWSTTKSEAPSDWSNDFSEQTSAKYKLDNKQFYLAVETSKLPNDGNYQITMEQEEFKYYNSRTIICTSVYAQQTGMYAYDNNPTPVVGKANWEVKRTPTDKTLEIIKKDQDTGAELKNAGFKIYAVLNNGTKGWVSGSVDGSSRSYEKDASSATEYSSGTEIKKLKYGKYYVFETKAPEGYELKEQDNYKKGPEGIPTPNGDWVYTGEKQLKVSSKDTVTHTAKNGKFVKPLIITKTDAKTGEELTGAKFKIYAVLDKALSDGTKEGWVSGDVSVDKEYKNNVKDANEYEAKQQIENLHYGTYYIYETKAPDQKGYTLKEQSGYNKKATGSDSLTGDWVYLGKTTINEKSGNSVPVTVTNEKTSYGRLRITKKDANTAQNLNDGRFKIYAVLDDGTKGWVGGSPSGEKIYGDEGATFKSDIDIEKLKTGKYYVFETKAPEGYNIQKQENYKKTDQTDPNIANIQLSDSDWVYLGNIEIPKDIEDSQIFEFKGENQKIVNLEGFVWKDILDTKLNQNDNVYTDGTNNTSKEERIEGIIVTLHKEDGTTVDTKTDKNGKYSFKDLNYWELVNSYVEFTYDNKKYVCVDPFAEKDAKMDLGINSKAQEYTMTTEKLDDNNLTGIEGNNPGKAVTYRNSKTLDYKDEKVSNAILTNNDKVKNNQATADDLKTTPLTGYYNYETYTISNVNLGLIEKLQPEFSITEDIAYMKVKFGDNVYKYEYMNENEQLTRTTVPTVNEQVSARTFTGKIYPSDVAYNTEHKDDQKLKVYMVYRIYVYNNTSHNRDNNYIEDKMYIESLTNKYDSNRYQLSTDVSAVDSKDISNDFGLWSNNGDAANIATYNCKETGRSEYKEGIKTEFDEQGNVTKPGYATAYIQFQLTENAVERIIAKQLTEEEIKGAPSTATATTFHEYWRADNVWTDAKDKYYAGHRKTQYDTSKLSNKTHYLHKSLNQTASSSDLYMRFDLPEKERAISGTVFEDTITEESKKNSEALGNGIKDDGENTVSNVLVELVNSKDAKTPVVLYRWNSNNRTYSPELASAIVAKGGQFTFEGVVPGYYYVRFTYGDGTVKYTDVKGNEVSGEIKSKLDNSETEVKINDYKSTIIDAKTTDGKLIQAAMEADEKDNSKAEWYKDITGENYSTALDDMAQRKTTNGYVYYSDGTVHDEQGKEITDKQTLINAYTPKISVTIENDKDEERTSSEAKKVVKDGEETLENQNYYYFNGFNFGIITVPNSVTTTAKTVSKLSLTDQVGTTIVSESPNDKKAQYVSALDKTGKMVKLEIDQNLIYGSELEPTYKITITNKSDLDYIEKNENSPTYGYYYKYGIKTDDASPKAVTIKEVQDNLDKQYDVDSVKVVAYYVNENETKKEIEITTPGGQKEESTEKTVTDENGTTTTTNTLKITGWSDKLERNQSESVEYTVKALLSSDNEDGDGFTNSAQVTQLKLDKLTTLSSSSEWDKKDDTVVSITPPTGADKTNTYWVAATIALIALAVGIIVINQKALKE